eukprot:TRINITY_DN1499_c0_g1_i2.p1 TRINITY_DN1499_c0_g1~~TRINITY_DN1499_c0_g1_i2.p1  ORF type:complete len:177 (-),score=52.64 TRINITY_DN1499_c0_g1_i2:11-541(-)
MNSHPASKPRPSSFDKSPDSKLSKSTDSDNEDVINVLNTHPQKEDEQHAALATTTPKKQTVTQVPRTPGSEEKIKAIRNQYLEVHELGFHTGNSRGPGWTKERKEAIEKQLQEAEQHILKLEAECQALRQNAILALEERVQSLEERNLELEEENDNMKQVFGDIQKSLGKLAIGDR